MLINLGNYLLNFKLYSLQHVFPEYFLNDSSVPLYSQEGVYADHILSCPRSLSPAWRKRQPLAAVLRTFALFHQSYLLWLCFLWCRRQQASLATYLFYKFLFLGTGLWGWKQNPCSPGPPESTAAMPHHDAAVTLLDRDRRARFSAGLVLGEVDSPILQLTMILAQGIWRSAHSSNRPVVLCKSTA